MIEITERANAALRAVMGRAERVPAGLRITARDGGCSGPNWSMGLVVGGLSDDHVITTPSGITMFVDEETLPSLIGTAIDYVETEGGWAFSFQNPRFDAPSAKSCSCGKSSCSS